ncbi:radical SAM protein [Myxococcota bacterium]|nr:radical SAM protein [Myxococcota bacterium]
MTSDQVLFSPVTRSLAHSSLGFHAAWGALAPLERACLPDVATGGMVRSLESGRSLGEFQVIWTSVAWELEVEAWVRALRESGIAPIAADRPATDPLVIAGGPLTLSNPDLAGAVADAVFVGDADQAFPALRRAVDRAREREDALEGLARIPGVWVPSRGGKPPSPVRAEPADPPLRSLVTDEPNEFGGAFLVEVGRGCPRGCTFCVARGAGTRSRFVPATRILDAIPREASRVGLLGAAVSDHPELIEIVKALNARGAAVTLGSVRADRVTPELVSALAASGLRTLTVAADGPSEGMRRAIRKGVTEDHLRACAEVAAGHGLTRLKIYAMTGLPGEEDHDVEELARLVCSLAERVSVSLSVSPFVPKRFTPLEGSPFAGIPVLRRRLALLARAVGGRARLRVTSPREAEREWRWSHLALEDARSAIRDLLAGEGPGGGRGTRNQSRFKRARSSSSKPK